MTAIEDLVGSGAVAPPDTAATWRNAAGRGDRPDVPNAMVFFVFDVWELVNHRARKVAGDR